MVGESIKGNGHMNTILRNVHDSLVGGVATRREAVNAWLANQETLKGDSIARPPKDLVQLFTARAERAACGVRVVANRMGMEAAIEDVVNVLGVQRELVSAPEPQLRELIGGATRFKCHFRAAETRDQVGVALPMAAAAETGTLVFRSGPESPTTVAFVPEYLIAILPCSSIVLSYEEALERIGAHGSAGSFPTRIHFVTGPSRTADIEEVLLLGAHGPRKVFILVVNGI